MKLELEVNCCGECPCLRNDKYGDFRCFYDTDYGIFDLSKIDSTCPLKKEPKGGDDS